jgi:hypothetical protein
LNARQDKIPTIDKTKEDTKDGITKDNNEQNKLLYGRKAKLVEAMSVPVESDIAIR